MTIRLRQPQPGGRSRNPRDAIWAIRAASDGQVEAIGVRAGVQVPQPARAWHATVIDARDGALPASFPGVSAAIRRAGAIFSVTEVNDDLAALIATRAAESGLVLVILRPHAAAETWRAVTEQRP